MSGPRRSGLSGGLFNVNGRWRTAGAMTGLTPERRYRKLLHRGSGFFYQLLKPDAVYTALLAFVMRFTVGHWPRCSNVL